MPLGKKDLPSCLSLRRRVLGGLSSAWERDQTFSGCSCLELSLQPAPPGRLCGEAESPSGVWEQL